MNMKRNKKSSKLWVELFRRVNQKKGLVSRIARLDEKALELFSKCDVVKRYVAIGHLRTHYMYQVKDIERSIESIACRFAEEKRDVLVQSSEFKQSDVSTKENVLEDLQGQPNEMIDESLFDSIACVNEASLIDKIRVLQSMILDQRKVIDGLKNRLELSCIP